MSAPVCDHVCSSRRDPSQPAAVQTGHGLASTDPEGHTLDAAPGALRKDSPFSCPRRQAPARQGRYQAGQVPGRAGAGHTGEPVL